MSFTTPAFRVARRSVEQPRGEAGLWAKFPPMTPAESPPTPELLDFANPPQGTRINPVIEVMFNAGLTKRPKNPGVLVTDLMHGMTIPTWDLRPGGLFYMLFRQAENPLANGTFPAPTIRVPRGALFHAESQGHGPPPHTIHWHGIEPTSMNDGVGHCSMEIGQYLYQWQGNFIGTYFYHCHRNTVQHFEFGLYGLLLICPSDSFFATLTDRTVPIGAGRDRIFRVAANLVVRNPNDPNIIIADFRPLFPGFVDGDPVNGVFVPDPGPDLDRGDVNITFPTDPHAFTVPYDVEAFWVLDDRDSVWSDFAPDAFAFFPAFGNRPGLNDGWGEGFFNDYNADYWFVTGVPVVPDSGVKGFFQEGTIFPELPPPIGGIGGVDVSAIGGVIPAGLNSGKGVDGNGNPVPFAATQIAINAQVDQTILVRILDAAYNHARITFPVDVVIIGFDGRALGVPPFALYNNAFMLPANTPFTICTARRFDVLMRSTTPVSSFAVVEFLDNQGATIENNLPVGPVLQTVRIPINIV